MRCRSARREVALLVRGDLPEDRDAHLRRHLEQCPGCAAELALQRRAREAVDALVRADAPAPLPDDFARQVQRRIAEGEIPRSTAHPRAGRRRWSPAWVGGVAALAGAVIILLYIAPPEPGGVDVVAARPPTSARDRARIEWDRRPFRAAEGPFRLDEWQPTGHPGLYAVLHRPDPEHQPHTYVIDFCGQSAGGLDLSDLWLRHLRQELVERTGPETEIYVAEYPLPGSSSRERRRLQQMLVRRWEPYYNGPRGA